MKLNMPLLALLLGAFVSHCVAQSPEAFESLLTQARQHSAEKSWARAREAYTAAGKLAPDEDAGRWCALWAVEAALHLSYRDGINPEETSKEHAALLAPYEHGRARDDFWLAALEVRMNATRQSRFFLRAMRHFWDDVVTGADELGRRPVTAANAAHYAGFLLRHLEGIFDPRPFYVPPPPPDRLLPHLRAASESPVSAENRIWLKLYAAHVSEGSQRDPNDVDDAFAAAERIALDSPASSTARAAGIAWRARAGRLPPDAEGFPNIPVWLSAMQSALAELPAAPDHILTRQARQALEKLHADWQNPRLTVAVPNLYRADETVAFGVGATLVDQLRFSIHRIAPALWRERQHGGSSAKSPVAPAGAERVAEWTTSLGGAPRYAWQTRFVPPPTPLGPGLYAVSVRGDEGAPVVRFFAVSSVSAICLSTPAGIEYFVYDNESGEPWPDRPVQVIYPGKPGSSGDEIIFDVRTDAQGRTAPHRPPPDSDGRFPHLLIADGHPVLLPASAAHVGTYEDDNTTLQLDLFMDRALFRPGETVNWKLVARLSKDGRLEIPTRPFTFDVLLRGEPLIPQQRLKWSERGTAHGAFVIPADARPGEAELVLNKTDDDAGFSRPMGWTRDTGTRPAPSRRPVESETRSLAFFTVDNFRPPPARLHLELAGDRASLRPGGTATFRLRAEYFSGGPVTNASATFRLQTYPELLSWRTPLAPELREWKDSLKAPRTVVTDAEGIATVQVDIPASIPDDLPFHVGVSLELNGAAAVSTYRMVAITPTGLNLELKTPDPYARNEPGYDWVLPGETLTYRYRFLDPFGDPVFAEGETILREQQWREIWLDADGNPVAGEALLEARLRHGAGPEALPSLGWTRLVAEEVNSTAASAPSAPDREGWHTVSLVVPHAGVYEVLFLGTEHAIHPHHDYIEQRFPRPIRLIAADEHSPSLALSPEKTFLLHRPAASSDEPPRFLAILPDRIRQGLITFATPDQVHTLRIKGPQRVHAVVPPGEVKLPARGIARLLVPGEKYPPVASFDSTRRSSRFTTTLVKTSANDRPGEVSAWKLATHDDAGRPVRAEVAVGVSDEAVNRLLPRPPLPRLPFVSRVSLKPAYSKASGLWQPGAVTLEGWDPRPGLAAYRARHVPSSLPAGLRSLSLIAERFVATVDMNEGGPGLTGTSSRRSGPTKTEQALDEQPYPAGAADENNPKITVRRHFVSTAFWAPQIETDANGEATFHFNYPDNLTEWRVSAYSVGHDGESFGAATTLVQSSLPFQARLLAPRLLVAGDSTELTTTLVNRTDQPVVTKAALSLGGTLRAGDGSSLAPVSLTVPADGDSHARWHVNAETPGDALVTLQARTKDGGDAMQVPIPVIEDGFQQATSASAHLASDREAVRLQFSLPDTLARDRTNVTLHLTPNRARAILDALPYLVDYPYGCVEQTVSRFLPAIIARKTLRDLGFSAEEIERHVLRDETSSARRRRLRSAGLTKLDDVVNESLRRLEDMRSDHGLYGWWGYPSTTDHWMTAYALLGLSMAREQGYRVNEESYENIVDTLSDALAEAKDASPADAVALALLVFATGADRHEGLRARFEALYAERDRLAPAGRAGLLLAAKTFGTPEQRSVLLRNLENGATRVRDVAYGDTVHWGRMSGCWLAEDSAVESTALTLLALQEIDPAHPDIPAAAHWLVLNRLSGHWTNTRNTALSVLALSRTLDRASVIIPELEVDILLNGQPLQRLTIDRHALLSPKLILTLDSAALDPGENELELRRVRGAGPLYAVARASAWTASKAVKPHGHLASAERVFVRHAEQRTLARTLAVTPTLLADADAAIAGERVTAHVRLHFPHALNYVMVEVPKPAGCEPVNPLSAWDARLVTVAADAPPGSTALDAASRSVYREEHDGKSVFFLHSVPAGASELRFDLRAIHPGDYRALPAKVEAMYVPEVRANTDARRMKIAGKEE